jgi:hypothetical protein
MLQLLAIHYVEQKELDMNQNFAISFTVDQSPEVAFDAIKRNGG